jgi:glycosyltransferase involved in cell wall biosynthesis
MRVARLVEKLPPEPGGKEIHAVELTRALADLGVEQHVFARMGDEFDPRVKLSRPAPHFAAETKRNLVAFSLWGMRRMVKGHRGSPFDAVHVHGDFVEASAAATAAKLCGMPALMTVHGDFGSVRWHNALRRATFQRMSTIWTVSESVADSVRGVGVDVPIVVRPSAVREEFFEARTAERKGGIVFVGRLTPVKGLQHLIAAHDLVAAELGVSCTLFGNGTGRYADEVIRSVEARPLMQRREERDPRRLAEALASATALVLPSVELGTMREGVPTALLEAIASRTPVIAANTGGLAALLDHGRAGLLVRPGDPRDLADAIAATVKDPAAARQRAERALALGYVRRWADLASEVAERYEQVAGGRPRSHGRG